MNNQIEMVRFLLTEMGINSLYESFDVRDHFGNEPLHYAIMTRSSALVKLLLNHHASPISPQIIDSFDDDDNTYI